MPTVREGEPYYIEHVTRDVAATRALLETAHGWHFAPPDPALGGAVVAILPNGARCGIRAPLREDEAPVTRTYVRVASVKRAAARATKAGATVALGGMSLGKHGKIDIFLVGGVELGVWEVAQEKVATRKRAGKKAEGTRTGKGRSAGRR